MQYERKLYTLEANKKRRIPSAQPKKKRNTETPVGQYHEPFQCWSSVLLRIIWYFAKDEQLSMLLFDVIFFNGTSKFWPEAGRS